MNEFMNTISRYINPQELIADILIISFFFVFNTLILPPGETIISFFGETALVILILLIDLAVPQYVSGITSSYARHTFRIKRVVMIAARFVGWLVCGMLGFILPIVMMVSNIIGEGAMLILIVAGLVSVIIGYITGDNEKPEQKKDEKESSGFVFGIMLILLILIVLGGLVYMITFFSNGQTLYGFLTLGGMIAGLIIIPYLLLEGMSRITETVIFSKFVEPALIVILVLLWQDLFHALLSAGTTVSGHKALLVLYAFSGVLPVRLMMMFEPPVKPISILTGLSALAFYFWVYA